MRLRVFKAAVTAILGVTLLACGHNAEKAKLIDLKNGRQFYQQGKYGDAEIQFRKAIQEDPKFGDALVWLGRTEKQRGNYTAAFASFRQAVASQPDQSTPKVELVNLLLLAYLGDPSRPAPLYKEISDLSDVLLAQNADSFDSTRIKGYLAMIDGQQEKAIELFQSANQLKRDEPDVITAMVESLFLAKQDTRADEIARDFLHRNPACGPLYTVMYQHYAGVNRLADAEAILKEKVSRNPKESMYRLELARHYARFAKTPEMKATLNELLDNPKDFPGALLDVGDFYAESRNWTEARSLYERGAAADPKSKVLFWKKIARIDLAVNDRAAARQLLDRILQEQPRDGEARASRTALRMSGNDPQEKKLAVAEWKKLTDDFTENVDYRIQYAEALRLTGETQAAKAQYVLISQRQPRNASVLQEIADLSIRERNLDDALQFAGRVLTLDSRNVRALLVKSSALAAKGRFQEARSVLIGVTLDHPELREAQLQLALLDIEQKHYADAEQRLRKSYQPGKADVRVLEGMVELYKAQNQLPKAVALLQSELQKNPQADQVRSLAAAVAADAGDYRSAIQHYENLARTQPGSAEIAIRLGLAYQAQHDLPRALAEFERGRQLAPAEALAHAYLGKVLDEIGRKSDAIQSYRQSLALNDHNPWVLNDLAYLIAESGGDLGEAMKLARAAVQQAPEDQSFNDTIGWVYLKKKDFASAGHIFEAISNKSPKTAVFHIHLAMALLEAGDAGRARTELKTAEQLSINQEDRDLIGRLLARAGTI